MIPIVENLLTEIIEERLKFIKTNTDIVNVIFRQATETMKARLKEYISNGNIRVVRGFPTDRASLPCYTIMLGGEREQEKSLGNFFDDEEDYTLLSETEDLVVTRKDSKLVVVTTHKPIEIVTAVTLEGAPIGFGISAANGGSATRGVITLDEESGVKFGDTVSVSYEHKQVGTEVYGSFFNTQYRIETWTNNGDLTVMLYHLLKWIVLSSRGYLEEQGLSVQTLGGIDFEPLPEYLPELVYRRALTFECLTENTFEQDFGYIQGINVTGEVGGEE